MARTHLFCIIASYVLLLSRGRLAAAHTMDVVDTIDGHGVIGFGITMYEPLCAQACSDAAPSNLTCSPTSTMQMSDDMDMDMDPSPECRASNTPLLQTIAFCIQQQCPASVLTSMRETWWQTYLVGRKKHQPRPALTYEQALDSLTSVPTAVASDKEVLTTGRLIDPAKYTANYNSDANFADAEKRHSLYGIILFVICALAPVLLHVVRLFDGVLGRSYRRGMLHLATKAMSLNVPGFPSTQYETCSLGMSLALAGIWLLNIILCAVGYKSASPNAWYDSTGEEIKTYVANRTGVLSFVNIGLLILFAGRNNGLLQLTRCSRTTYLVLHKHIATIATLQACFHSAIYLQDYLAQGKFESEARLPYWVWGSVATLAMVVLLPASFRWARRAAYEIFYQVHIVFSIFAVVGSWYHIQYRFAKQWGYEVWLYIAIAVWAFDHLVRSIRLALNRRRTAIVTRVDDDYLRISVPGLQAKEGHVYAVFPTINPLERHPFSIAACTTTGVDDANDLEKASLSGSEKMDAARTSSEEPDAQDHAKQMTLASGQSTDRKSQTIFFARVRSGLTKRLAARVSAAGALAGESKVCRLPILLEGPYDCHRFETTRQSARRYDKTICIAGGVGITALLPMLLASIDARQAEQKTAGKIVLYWTVRSRALVEAVERIVGDHTKSPSDSASPWHHIDAKILVQDRLNVSKAMRDELSEVQSLQIYLCAPQSLALDVKEGIRQYLRPDIDCSLVEESFAW